MDQKKFCTNCGTPASLNAMFCTNCGMKFPTAAPTPTVPALDPEATVSIVGGAMGGAPQQSAPASEPSPIPEPEFSPIFVAPPAPPVSDLQSTVSTVSTVSEPVPIPEPEPVAASEPEPAQIFVAPPTQPASDLEATMSTVSTASEPSLIPETEPAPIQPDLEDAVGEAAYTYSVQESAPDRSSDPQSQWNSESTVSVIGNTAAQQPQYVPQPEQLQYQPLYAEPAPTESIKLKKKSSAGSVVAAIISVMLAIILIVPVVATALVGALRSQLSDDAINNAVSELEVFDYVNDNIYTEYVHPNGTDKGFVAWMHYMLYPFDNEIDADFEDKLVALLNASDSKASDNIRDFISDKLTGIVGDVREGSFDTNITTDDVIELVKSIEGDIEKEFGYTLTETDYADIRAEIDASNIESFTVESVKEENKMLFTVLETVMSDITFYIMIAVCALLLGLIIALTGRRFQKGLIFGGFSLLISGAVIYLGSSAFDWLVVNSNLIENDIVRSLLDVFTDSAVGYLKFFGIIVAGAAAVLFVTAIIVIIIKCARKKKA